MAMVMRKGESPMGNKMVLISVVAVLLLSGCATWRQQESPGSWMETLYDREYPEETYLCAVGAGSTRENAVNAAFSSLSQVFHAQVDSTISTYASSTATHEGSEVVFYDTEAMIDQGSVSTKTDLIIGAQVVNTYRAPDGMVWVRVAVHRKNTAQLYEKEMEQLEQDVAQLRMRSMQETSVLARYFRLQGALPKALAHQQLAEQVRMLTGKDRPSLLKTIERELDGIASTVTLSLEVLVSVPEQEEQMQRQIESAFASLFHDYGFTVVNDTSRSGAKAVIGYFAAPAPASGSPYAHVRYQLSVQVIEGMQTVASYRLEKRETALNDQDAMQRALRFALHEAVGALGSQLEGR